jgi:hypothetical protein
MQRVTLLPVFPDRLVHHLHPFLTWDCQCFSTLMATFTTLGQINKTLALNLSFQLSDFPGHGCYFIFSLFSHFLILSDCHSVDNSFNFTGYQAIALHPQNYPVTNNLIVSKAIAYR